VYDRSTRLLTEADKLAVYFHPERIWIIPEDIGV
jgi:hypothetical protein